MTENIKVDNHVKEALRRTIDAWNSAERDIKSAELSSGDIFLPAIFEMRYAGRRIIDALDEIISDEPDSNMAIRHINEAELDLLRARQDVIDALTSFISLNLDNLIKCNGPNAVRKKISDFDVHISKLNEVRKKISLSRRSRKDREEIYTEIRQHDLINLLDFAQKMQTADLDLSGGRISYRSSLFIQSSMVVVLGTLTAVLALVMSLAY